MAMRSWLFVPGDSEKKLAKVAGCGADVVIVDLEDAVAPASQGSRARPGARVAARAQRRPAGGFAALGAHQRARHAAVARGPRWRCMRGRARRDHGAQGRRARRNCRCSPPSCTSASSATASPLGRTRLLPLVSETPAAALDIADYARPRLPRLAGLTWGAEDFPRRSAPAASATPRGAGPTPSAWCARKCCWRRMPAGSLPIDTLHADFRDLAGLERVASESHADGFAGMLAIHPDQVPVINAAFMPGEDEIAEARRDRRGFRRGARRRRAAAGRRA